MARDMANVPNRRAVVGATAGVVFTGALAAPAAASAAPPGHVTIASPNGRLRMTVRVTDGRLRYQVARDGRGQVPSSGLGLDLADRPSLTGWCVTTSVSSRRRPATGS
ncbi:MULTISPECIES: glycoside hydrolase family 97 N-terminal domain-containing protein [Streptomyces violaceusniger group]|nr:MULTISPECIES: glycoside hydrolase family 97 N-terminal domain-containing protein [Streptomyces violaceusniger group]